MQDTIEVLMKEILNCCKTYRCFSARKLENILVGRDGILFDSKSLQNTRQNHIFMHIFKQIVKHGHWLLHLKLDNDSIFFSLISF